MTSNWFIVGDYIKRGCIFLCGRDGGMERRGDGEGKRDFPHSRLILPRCDVPLILIFSSQMRAILSITLHFNFSPLNISFLWYLQLFDSRVYKLQPFMCLQVRCDIAVNLPPQKINIAPMHLNPLFLFFPIPVLLSNFPPTRGEHNRGCDFLYF